MKYRLTVPLLLLCAVMLITGCSEAPVEHSFEAMDTYMDLKLYGDKDAAEAIEEEAHTLEGLLSVTDAESEIARLNAGESVALSEPTRTLLTRSLELCRETGGALDVTLYPVSRAWGFTTGDYRVVPDDELSELLTHVDYTAVAPDAKMTLPEGMALDLGATAKGFLADRALDILREHGCESAVLNLGGTVVAHGTKPDGSLWRIGVAEPENPASYFGYLSLSDTVAATSGSYERYFVQDGVTYTHILDPASGKPVDNGVLSVTAVCSEGVRADALSTALFVMGRDKAAAFYREHRDFDYVMLLSDGALLISEGLHDRFTLNDGSSYNVAVID